MRLLVACLLALVAAAPALASEERPTPAELESELVCPVCDTTLDTSSAPVALRMKAVIRQRIAEGATKSEIKSELVADFGPGVLETPPRQGLGLVAWVLPLLGVVAAAAAVGLLAWRWSRRRDGDPPAGADGQLDPELDRRLDAELARFE